MDNAWRLLIQGLKEVTVSVLKERRKLEEKESLALLSGRRLPQKDHESLSSGQGESSDTPEIKRSKRAAKCDS